MVLLSEAQTPVFPKRFFPQSMTPFLLDPGPPKEVIIIRQLLWQHGTGSLRPQMSVILLCELQQSWHTYFALCSVLRDLIYLLPIHLVWYIFETILKVYKAVMVFPFIFSVDCGPRAPKSMTVTLVTIGGD